MTKVQTGRTSLHLANNLGFKWQTVTEPLIEVKTKGFAYKDGRHLTTEDLAIQVRQAAESDVNVQKPERLLALLRELNGSYTFIVRSGQRLFAAVDRLRSMPLFYGEEGGRSFLSDDADWIKEQVGDVEADPLSVKEFMLTGYVTGPETLYPGVKQLQAGECLWFGTWTEPAAVTTYRYYRWIHGSYFGEPPDDLCQQMDQMHLRVFERLLDSVRGQTIVVPLSGGYDSRLIVTMLKRLGCEDVICFSYGKPGNWEAAISKHVAERLGYQWHFVPYDRRKWRRWFCSHQRHAYTRFGAGLNSLAAIQDWPAVWELEKSGILSQDAVFVPGHTGDFIAGGHIPYHWIDDVEPSLPLLLEGIWRKHYILWDIPIGRYLASFQRKTVDLLSGLAYDSAEDVASTFECWEWEERQAKFIVNSVRVYEYFGHEWRLPLWDNDVMDFWQSVPLKHRIGKNLYDRYVHNLFREHGVEYEQKTSQEEKAVSASNVAKLKRISEQLTDPRLGRYSLIDHYGCRKFYSDVFPANLARSVRRAIQVNTLGAYLTLTELDVS